MKKHTRLCKGMPPVPSRPLATPSESCRVLGCQPGACGAHIDATPPENDLPYLECMLTEHQG